MTLFRGLAGLAAALAIFALPADATEWQILSVNGGASTGDARIAFDAGGDLSGHTGCNSFRGGVQFSDGALVIVGPLATTRMACPGDVLTAQENAILRVLDGVVTPVYDPLSGVLTLSRGENSLGLAPIKAASDVPPERTPPAEDTATIFDTHYLNVYGLKGPLNVRQQPGTGSRVVAKVLAGTMLRSKGCEARKDRTWCHVQMLDASGTEGWAAGDYLEPAHASLRAGQGVFDSIGTLSCAFSSDEPQSTCDYVLARDGTHSVAMVVFKPDGSERVLFFAEGAFA